MHGLPGYQEDSGVREAVAVMVVTMALKMLWHPGPRGPLDPLAGTPLKEELPDSSLF